MSDTPAPATPAVPRRRFRWMPGAWILAAGVSASSLAYLVIEDHTFEIVALWVTVPVTSLLLAGWWLFASGLPWAARLAGVLAVASLAASLKSDGYEGDMLPRLRWRWQAEDEDRARRYFAETAPRGEPSQPGGFVSEPGASEPPMSAWPEFRGFNRDGRVKLESAGFKRDWQADPPRLLWRHPVGLGWSSFCVDGRRAFTQEQRDDREVVSCYDLFTGEPIWVHADTARFQESMGGDGPRATPTWSNGRIHALGATGILNCLDAGSGELVWSVDVLKDNGAGNLKWAICGSPLVHDGRVIVTPGGPGATVAAYDAGTGRRVWAAGDRPASYAAPRLVSLHGVTTLLVFGGDGLSAHHLDDGREMWFFPWSNQPKVNAALPIRLDPNDLLISSGYNLGAARLRIGGTPESPTVEVAWRSRGMKCKFNDPVVHDGFVYGLDEGILVCLDLEDGERRWKRGRYGYGQMLLVGDLLLIQADNGTVALVEASPDRFNELTRFRAIEGKTWNHPVLLSNNLLLVRNSGEAACYELPLKR